MYPLGCPLRKKDHHEKYWRMVTVAVVIMVNDDQNTPVVDIDRWWRVVVDSCHFHGVFPYGKEESHTNWDFYD